MSELTAVPGRDPWRPLLAPLAGCLGCAVGVLLLAWSAYAEGVPARLDRALLNRALVVGDGSAALPTARFLVHLGDPAPVLSVTTIACVAAILVGRVREALAAAVLVAGASATTVALKDLLERPRLDPALIHHPIVATAFPSGHSTGLAAVALAVVLVTVPAWRPAAVLLGGGFALVVGACLVPLGDHYPSDVVAGWLVAASWFCAVVVALRATEAPSRSETLTE
jgi:membrane-associated phospholipid phosphatase